jgi:hypothetical protein
MGGSDAALCRRGTELPIDAIGLAHDLENLRFSDVITRKFKLPERPLHVRSDLRRSIPSFLHWLV